MEIALYTTENRSLIALKRSGKISAIRAFNPAMIFQDPGLLRERFFQILKNSFDLENPKEIERLIFGIPGLISSSQGLVIESDELNQISVFKSYSGFSFKECFGTDIGEDNVFVISSALATTYGVRKEMSNISKPMLILTNENNTGVGLVWTDNSVRTFDWGQKLLPAYNNTSISNVIGKKGIEALIRSGSVDVVSDYSTRLISTIPFFVDQLNQVISKLGLTETKKSMKQKVRSVFEFVNSFIQLKPHLINFVVFTEFGNIIEEKLLTPLQGIAKVIFIDNENRKNKIAAVGCFEAIQYLVKKDKTVERVEYYAEDEKIYSFNNFSEFSNHWESVYSFANENNYYNVFFSDGSIQSITMRELKYSSAIEQFKF